MAQEPDRAGDRLSPTEFVEPQPNARPGGFWNWLNGSISKEQITRDLEAMKAGGMRGCEIWDVAACADPDRRVPAGPAFLGPESTQLIAHAIREADRLGLELGIERGRHRDRPGKPAPHGQPHFPRPSVPT